MKKLFIILGLFLTIILNGQILPGVVSSQRTNVATTGLSSGLLSYWKLDETSGTTATDAKALHNGTATTSTMGGTGKLGTCYTFSAGVGSGVVMPSTTDYNLTSTGSVSVWFTNSIGAWTRGHIVGTRGTYENAGFGIDIESGASPILTIAVGSSVDVALYQQNIGSNGTTWYHVVMTWDAASNLITYINGTAVDTRVVGLTLVASAYVLKIGENPDTFNPVPHSGKIDEVGIWNRVLTASEVTSLYNSGSGKSFDTF